MCDYLLLSDEFMKAVLNIRIYYKCEGLLVIE